MRILRRHRGHALAEGASFFRGSSKSQTALNILCERMRATKNAPRGLCRILERRHGLAEIVERGAVVQEERPQTSA